MTASLAVAGCDAALASRIGEPSIGRWPCDRCRLCLRCAPAARRRRAAQAREDEDGQRRADAALAARARSTTADRDAATRATSTRPSARAKRLPRGTTRKRELARRGGDVEGIAGARQLTGPRLVPLWLTLERNREYWTTHAAAGRHAPRSRSRAPSSSGSTTPARASSSSGSANFGKLNALWGAPRERPPGRHARRAARRSPSERAGGLAWEYYFTLRRRPAAVGLRPRPGHRPAGDRARGHAARAARPSVLPDRPARRSAIFETPTPQGVRVPAERRRPLRACTRSRPTCGSSTASSSRSSASTTSRELTGDPTRARRCSPRASARRAREVPTLRHRRLVAVLARLDRRTSPTSATTRCCATSSTSLCTRTDERRLLRRPSEHFTPYQIAAAGGRAGHRDACAAASSGKRALQALEDLARDADDHARRRRSCASRPFGAVGHGKRDRSAGTSRARPATTRCS